MVKHLLYVFVAITETVYIVYIYSSGIMKKEQYFNFSSQTTLEF